MKRCWLILPAFFLAVQPVAAGDPVEQDTLLTLYGTVEYAINYGLSMRTAINRRLSSTMDLFASRQALRPTARATLSTSGRQSLSSSSASFSADAAVGADYEL